MKILKASSFLILLITLLFSCQKEYSLENPITPAGTWQFNDDTKLYSGNIDTAYLETSGSTKRMNLMGKSSDGQQTFLLHLYATDSFTVGTYKASLSQMDFQYFSQAKTIYQADQFIGEFTVTITAIGNNSVTGIFDGVSEDSTGALKPLTLGKFTSRINLFGNGTGGGGTPPPAADYYPTTTGSFWALGNINADPTDSFMITATSRTKTIVGQLYNIFTYDGIPASTLPDSLFYRKGGGMYYENYNINSFFGSPGTPPDVEYKFLDETVAAGTTWQSSSFTVTDQGITYTVYFKMTLTEKATTPTTSGVVTSSDVLKVNYDYYLAAPGLPAAVFYKEVRWFAKGIGLIYNSFDDLSGSGPEIYKIGRYKVF